MNVVVGRQPILDQSRRTVAYELLFRSGTANRYNAADGNAATDTVISNAFMDIGYNRVLGSKRGFVNFTRDLLIEGKGLLLPRERVVIEVLESVVPDDVVVAACRKLKEAGFVIALDDVTDADAVAPLVSFAEYAKIDLPTLGLDARRRLCDYFHQRNVKVLAEKVETKEDFHAAVRDGCELYQGYFFARPELVSARRIPNVKMACLQLITEIQREELDFEHLEQIVRLDVALTRKLLCFINSAAFAIPRDIESIRQAFICLGERNIRKWVTLATLPALAAERPAELMTLSLVRARFCELAAEGAGLRLRSQSCFLLGLLSLLDAMVGRPLDELLRDMALDRHITDAILSEKATDTRLRRILELAIAFERSELDEAERLAKTAGIPLNVASDAYVEAISWANLLFN